MLKELHADGTAVRVLPSSFSLLRNLEMLSFSGCKGPPSASWLLSRRSSNSIGSMVHSLSGLCSLRWLFLSNCNLSDETNLSNLGCLSSLEMLDLSGNNFLTVPSNICQLSNLEWLWLENCKRLEALPELPSSIHYINAQNCTSLKDVSYQVLQSLFVNGKSVDGTFHGYDTPDLVPGWIQHENWELNVKAELSLRWLCPQLVRFVFAIICGSRIPDWIRYQSSGSEVKAELPPNWFHSNFLGFVFAVLFVPKTSTVHCSWSPVIQCSISLFYDASPYKTTITLDPFPFKYHGSIKSDHMCLLYAPLSHFNNWFQVTHIGVSFAIQSSVIYFGIQRCGLGLVYSNEDGNHSKSTVVLKEIYEEEPGGSGWSNVDGPESDNSDYFTVELGEPIANACSDYHSESENSDYYTANEEEPIATDCSEDHSESEMQPLKLLKCSHYHDIPS